MISKESAMEYARVREPIVEGIFYPQDPENLSAELSDLLTAAENRGDIKTGALAIIAPHAGYTYCGAYSAAAFYAASGRTIETVVVIAPVHREPADAIYLTESSYFSTPLGKIAVSERAVADLEDCGTRIIRNDIPHLEEHAIEVQLPFIQTLFPKANLVPIIVGRATLSNVRLLTRGLEATFADQLNSTLFVVSSNLSSHSDGDAAAESMQNLLDLVNQKDSESIISAYRRKAISACGAGGIAALCGLSLPSVSIELLCRTGRHTETDDRGKIIHYGAIAFYPGEGNQ